MYEGGIVFEEDFFNKNKMFNFSFISNGDFIDECKSKNSFFDIILGNSSFSKVQEINEAIHRIHGKFPLIFSWINKYRTNYFNLLDLIDKTTINDFEAITIDEKNLKWNTSLLSELWLSDLNTTLDTYNSINTTDKQYLQETYYIELQKSLIL